MKKGGEEGQAGSQSHPVLNANQARGWSKTVSGQIFGMMNLHKGSTTKQAPVILHCRRDPTHLYQTRHIWSVYAAPKEDLQAGLDRLHDQMPKNGWKVSSFGPDQKQGGAPTLTADSTKDRSYMSAVLTKSSVKGQPENPLLFVTVYSGCWRAPQGMDLKDQG
jgi:hypothetical protein